MTWQKSRLGKSDGAKLAFAYPTQENLSIFFPNQLGYRCFILLLL